MKLMRIGTTLDYDATSPMHVGVNVLECVDKYQYLGLWITCDGKWDTEFRERLQKVTDVWDRSHHFFADTNVPIRARWIVWCAMIRSRLEYGCEVFIMSDDQMKLIETMQLDAARLILGCNRHTSKDAIYGDLKCQPLAVRFARYRVRLYHEVSTMNSFLPLHHGVWDSSITSLNHLPSYSFRREARKIHRMYVNSNVEIFQLPDGWKWVKKVIDTMWVEEWKQSMQHKIDRAEERGSTAQMSLYLHLKSGWGDVPYTNLPDARFSQLLFKIRSGTLPVLAFEGKRDSPLSPACMCCHQGIDETIHHFLWECDGSAASFPAGLIRDRMLQGLRNIISASRVISGRYGQEAATHDAVLKRLALGSPVEMVFPDAFDWTENEEDIGLPREMRMKLTLESRAVANRMQGQIMNKVREWLKVTWQQRCKFVEVTLHPPQSPLVTPVVIREAEVRTSSERGRGVGRGRGRGRQRTIMEFFGSNWSDGTDYVGLNDVGSSSLMIATQQSGRGHVNDMPAN